MSNQKSQETKDKIRATLIAKGIRPKIIFDATGTKHSRPSPALGRKRPEWIGKKISEVKKGHSVSEETRKKISENLMGRFKGEESPNWIKDRTIIKGRHQRSYHDNDYKIWRAEVYKRDNWKCKIADENCKGKIEAHHILDWENYKELRYKVNNGITLCHAHHPRGRAKEKQLSPYFSKLTGLNVSIK